MPPYQVALDAANQPLRAAWRLRGDDRRHLQVIAEERQFGACGQ